MIPNELMTTKAIYLLRAGLINDNRKQIDKLSKEK